MRLGIFDFRIISIEERTNPEMAAHGIRWIFTLHRFMPSPIAIMWTYNRRDLFSDVVKCIHVRSLQVSMYSVAIDMTRHFIPIHIGNLRIHVPLERGWKWIKEGIVDDYNEGRLPVGRNIYRIIKSLLDALHYVLIWLDADGIPERVAAVRNRAVDARSTGAWGHDGIVKWW